MLNTGVSLYFEMSSESIIPTGRGKFFGKTVVITGASRGIGKEIALKLAKDGANIVVAAKTTTPHPKLPGTIYTAAEEIEKAGGKSLACVVDVRDENSVQQCIDQTVKKFGGVDILINNASAIQLSGTLETDMKRYDLMHAINTRGTYLMSKTCIPYLKQSKNPHILNISPPLLMEPQWFANHVAYTMAKYGMSMCVLGMHEEFRPDGIAVNALWPLTGIWTAAMDMLSSGGSSDGCRKPAIMSDAAYAVLSRNSREFTGNFAIDEDILREEGVTDFEKYAMKPGAPLLPDFFIPSGVYDHVFTQKKDGKRSKSRVNIEKSLAGLGIEETVAEVKKTLTPEMVQKMKAVYQFELTGEGAKTITLNLRDGNGDIYDGESADSDVQFSCAARDFPRLFSGEVSPTTMFMTRKLKIKGDMKKALNLENFMKKMQKSKL